MVVVPLGIETVNPLAIGLFQDKVVSCFSKTIVAKANDSRKTNSSKTNKNAFAFFKRIAPIKHCAVEIYNTLLQKGVSTKIIDFDES